MDMVVVEDYYLMTSMDGNINKMKLTHVLSNFPLTLRAPFSTSSLLHKFE